MSTRDKVVFATGPSGLSPEAAPLREMLAWLLTGRLGVEVEINALPTYGALAEALREGLDCAWLPPALYVMAERDRCARLLLAGVRAHTANFFGALFVRADSPFVRASDLQGSRAAWVSPESCSGYLMPRLELKRLGLDPARTFASEEMLESHQNVVAAVTSGRADVGATYLSFASDGASGAIARAGWLDARPPAAMRVLVTAGPIPSDVVVVSPSTPSDRADALADVLSTLHRHPRGATLLSQFFGVDWFERAQPVRYDAVRAALLSSRS